ncbi:porin family protein [Massilia sp. CF038]|jgi:opacity protein-like surface antigen|uniref:porin family protein n=1 Tax=Massilia sp. CF038 TaxID=1881045 RepID=UPI0009183A37|nr:porin family protein [Massilia sp. CF038]SHH39070.1 Opacity protein [Massilia sp. CF038]
MFNKLIIAASLALLSSAAMAADQPYFYAGGDIGNTDFRYGDKETSYGAFGGYQINQNFALEGAYHRLASDSEFGYDIKLDQIAVSAVATIPLSNGFNVFGRLGYSHLSSKANYSDNESYKSSENKPLYGLGVGFAFTPSIMGRLEVQKVAREITNISAGVGFRF